MSNLVSNNTATVTTDQYFGGCPQCGNSGVLNVRKSHYGACETHKVFWPIGYNLFSSWQEENPDIWRANECLLTCFTEVTPIYPQGERPVKEPVALGCALCDKPDTDGGITWNDSRFLCRSCWREAAEQFQRASADARKMRPIDRMGF